MVPISAGYSPFPWLVSNLKISHVSKKLSHCFKSEFYELIVILRGRLPGSTPFLWDLS